MYEIWPYTFFSKESPVLLQGKQRCLLLWMGEIIPNSFVAHFKLYKEFLQYRAVLLTENTISVFWGTVERQHKCIRRVVGG